MQPDMFIQIQIPATLRADIETVAATNGQSVNAWIDGLLENAVTQAQERAAARIRAEEEQRKLVEARQEQRFDEVMKKHRGNPLA